jgi:hypothetical protein
VLHTIVIKSKCRPGVIRRINIDALNLPLELLLQRLEREQVVTVDQDIVEDVVFGDVRLGVIGFVRILQQDARLQVRAFVFAYPCQFQPLFPHAHDARLSSRFCWYSWDSSRNSQSVKDTLTASRA